MPSSWVIKLPVADTEANVVLINVSAKKRDDIDLDLLATDGDSAFKGKVRERSFANSKATSYDGSDDDWRSILKHVLVTKQKEALSDTIRENLEISCVVSGKDPKAILTINFRSRVEDITQRLGAITLQQTQDTDNVDLFGWAGQVIDKRDELEDTLEKEKLEADSANDTISSLQNQLADLIKAKQEHEDELMQKFAALLNEKKTQLRKRTRQLATAKVDPETLKQLEEDQGLNTKKSTSRRQKRTAKQAAAEDSDSDGFEDRMDVDKKQELEEEEQQLRDRSRSTSRASITDTDSDDDLDQPVTSQTETAPPSSSKPASKTREPDVMPPRRDLPFTRKTKEQQKAPPPKAKTPDDEETESEEDEL